MPLPLYLEIVNPGDGAPIGSIGETDFQAVAYDPDVASSDGAGIMRVVFTLYDSSGGVIHSRNENGSAYCAFGGDSPCSTMPPGQWSGLAPGSYTLTAEAFSNAGKPSATTSVSFTKP